MRLTPKELDRATLFTVAEMARRRRGRGLKLNHPEAVALIADEIMEEARAGKSYEEVMDVGGRVLTIDDVLDGVADLASPIKVEAGFDSGTKLVVIDRPIR